MVARIPLIVNSSAEQIQELPSGDSINIPGDLNVTGTVTGSALHSVKLTADGTIAANAAVTLTSAGKAKAISTVAESTGSSSTFYTHTADLHVGAIDDITFDSNQSAALLVYRRDNDAGSQLPSYQFTSGALSGTSITWSGTHTPLNSTSDSSSVIQPNVISHQNGGGVAIHVPSSTVGTTNRDLKYTTFTLSGSTVTWGTATPISAWVSNVNLPDRHYCVYLGEDGGSHYFAVAYRSGWLGGSMVGKLRILKWDGQDNVTLGSEADIGSPTSDPGHRLLIDPQLIALENRRFLVKNGATWRVCTRVGTTDVRQGADSSTIGSTTNHKIYDPYSKFLICYTGTGIIQAYDINGEDITYRFQSQMPSGIGNGRVLLTDKGQVLHSYIDGSNNGKQIFGTFNDAKDDITWNDAATTWDSGDADNSGGTPRTVKANDGKVITAYHTDPASEGDEDGKSVVTQTATTTLTADNFLGFSSASYSDGETASISILGSQSTQSGLTVGKKYYVQDNGTIGTSKGWFGVVAGKALSATKLLITEV